MTETLTKTVELINERGLHARASAVFVKEAAQFDATVTVAFEGERVGTQSVMDLMILGALYGHNIEISAEGPQAGAALDALCDLVARKFDEEK